MTVCVLSVIILSSQLSALIPSNCSADLMFWCMLVQKICNVCMCVCVCVCVWLRVFLVYRANTVRLQLMLLSAIHAPVEEPA